MDNSVQIPLDLPDVWVLEVSKTEQGDWLIGVESTVEGTKCHRCGRPISHFQGYDQSIRVRHLPVFGQSVFIEFRPKRYRCDHCEGKPTTTQRVSWHELRSPNTKPYEQWVGCDLNLIQLKGERKTILVELIPELTPTSRC
jgi:transposase